MLAATGACYGIGGRALVATVDLTVGPGELVAVVGPNGAGKSTLLALLAGDLRPTSGTVTLHGRPACAVRPRELARLRAVMPQASTLQFGFTAAEVVELGAAAGGAPDPTAAVAEALSIVGAAALGGRRFPTLSGGEQARVTLARVLAQDTAVVLLDEPTAHLDLHHQELVLGVARDQADRGKAVVAVLHDLAAAARYADRVAVLSGGRLVACAPPAAALHADLLSTVYSHPITVVPHPLHGTPLPLVCSTPGRKEHPLAGRLDGAGGVRPS